MGPTTDWRFYNYFPHNLQNSAVLNIMHYYIDPFARVATRIQVDIRGWLPSYAYNIQIYEPIALTINIPRVLTLYSNV